MQLLIELGTEELPAQALSELAQSFATQFEAGLRKRGLSTGAATAWWTPRRMAVNIAGLSAQAAAQQQERRGPALAAAVGADGQPSKALQGFAASCGVAVEALEKLETDKGSWFVHRALVPGKTAPEIIAETLAEVLSNLPIPKPMRWGDHEHRFLRPVHWLLALLDQDVVPLSAFGKQSDRITYGHRFHAPAAIALAHAKDYQAALQAAHVLVDPGERTQRIRQHSAELAQAISGHAQMRDALVDEVANLTEWPVPLRCAIPSEFMRLPAETIITTIETHQKYFPIFDQQGKLLPAFIGVANLDSLDPNEIRKGYERVVRPRLQDAAFFFNQDLKAPLASYQSQLQKVTFQQKLGSVWDKSLRVATLAEQLAASFAVDRSKARQAAELAKCDLLSRMVGEFPELQGVMGKTYALAQGLDGDLALALDEVYCPRAAGAPIASTSLGQLLAVCERLDTLAGIFAVGQKPSGNKDAFGLRRAALGLARTLIEGAKSLDLNHALELASKQIPGAPAGLADELYTFIVERLRAYYVDQGIDPVLLDAVAERKPSDLLDFNARLRAVSAFRALPEATSLAAANKRIRNILRKLDGPVPSTIDAALFESDLERGLDQAVGQAEIDTLPLLANKDYVAVLTRLAGLREPIDLYFDKVMVMAEQLPLRQNRLASLKRVSDLFLNVADVSVL
jgi:glycyl-tRNA synthetase beta chain